MAKPDFKPEWAIEDVTTSNGTDNKIRPTEATRNNGHDYKQKPPVEEINWQFNNIYEWIDYLEGITDGIGITAIATEQQAKDGAINTAIMTPLRTRQFSSQYGIGNTPDQAVNLVGVNLNNTVTSGFYFVSGGTNFPGSFTKGFLEVNTSQASANTFKTRQVFSASLDVGGVQQLAYYERFQFSNNTWSSWQRVVPEQRRVDTGAGLVGGGDLSANRTLSMGTPSTITGTTTNSVSGDTHTHQINLPSFFDGTNNNLTRNSGFQNLPGGLKLQWGRHYIGDITQNQIVGVVFDEPFTQPFHCFAITEQVGGAQSNVYWSLTGISNNVANFKATETAGIVQNIYINWFALGRS